MIDFQGGRLGPLQYDLASLLIDPYVALPRNLQEVLLKDYMEKLSRRMPVDPSDFGSQSLLERVGAAHFYFDALGTKSGLIPGGCSMVAWRTSSG